MKNKINILVKLNLINLIKIMKNKKNNIFKKIEILLKNKYKLFNIKIRYLNCLQINFF